MMDDLIAWLREQIAEDERMARTFDWAKPSQYEEQDLGTSPEYVTLYISPARVLAECAAKRKLVDYTAKVIDGDYVDDGEPVMAEHVLRMLAEPYGASSRDGYRKEWKP